MKLLKCHGLLLTSIALLFSCSKKDNTTKSSRTDLYLTGSIYLANGNTIAAYWKNDTMYQLQDTGKNTTGAVILASGNDVYVLGFPNAKGIIYWKNGVPTHIAGNSACNGHSIAVQNSDVYIVGADANGAAYWVNGVDVHLFNGYAHAIAVKGTDIYVVGNISTKFGIEAVLWKNGTLTSLSNSTYSDANDMIINGNDVYVAGYQLTSGEAVAGYWKNGVFNPVNQASGIASNAYGITLSENDVYLTGVSGTSFTTAKVVLWKNNVPTYLTQQEEYLGMNPEMCVAVNGNNTYVTGQFINRYSNCYWKNNSLISIGTLSTVQSVWGVTVVAH